jgi:hypothetical protein
MTKVDVDASGKKLREETISEEFVAVKDIRSKK